VKALVPRRKVRIVPSASMETMVAEAATADGAARMALSIDDWSVDASAA
jgi:hypothetical protein